MTLVHIHQFKGQSLLRQSKNEKRNKMTGVFTDVFVLLLVFVLFQDDFFDNVFFMPDVKLIVTFYFYDLIEMKRRKITKASSGSSLGSMPKSKPPCGTFKPPAPSSPRTTAEDRNTSANWGPGGMATKWDLLEHNSIAWWFFLSRPAVQEWKSTALARDMARKKKKSDDLPGAFFPVECVDEHGQLFIIFALRRKVDQFLETKATWRLLETGNDSEACLLSKNH